MNRNVMLLIVAATFALLSLAGVSKFFDGRTISSLEAAGDSLRLRIAATNVRLDAYSADSTRFLVVRDSFELLSASLRADLKSARGRTRVVVVTRDSARATIDVDTLSAGLRNLLAIEREAAKSFETERDLERELREKTQAQLARTSARLREAQGLLWTVMAQRDSAMSIVAGHEKRLGWSFAKLFQDIPRKLGCSAGGAIVAELNDGEVLLGAAIGLAACLIAEGIFR